MQARTCSNWAFAHLRSLSDDYIKWGSRWVGGWVADGSLKRRPRGPVAAPTDLGDDGDLEAKVMQPNFGNVNPVDEDLSFRCLFDPKQAKRQGGLSGPGPSHNAHLWRAERGGAERPCSQGGLKLQLGQKRG